MKKKFFTIFAELTPLVLIHILAVITFSFAIGAAEYFVFRLSLNISFSIFCLSVVLPAALIFLCLELTVILLSWIIEIIKRLKNYSNVATLNIFYDKVIDFFDFSTPRFIFTSLLGLTAGSLLLVLMEKVICH